MISGEQPNLLRVEGKRWRLLYGEPATGSWNMAVDEAIMLLHARGQSPPTLRFYQWRPPTVSLGYFQRWDKEVAEEACRRLGIGLVRRPTGGRAVLHDREVTYSVVIRQEWLPGSILETYRELSRGLLAGFELLGVRAEMATLEKGAGPGFAGGGRAAGAACFDSPSWYELVVDGRKVVGSAQVRREGTILQHGSILLELDIDLLLAVLSFPDGEARERTRRILEKKAGSLRPYLGERANFAEVSAAMADGFKRALGVELVPGELTGEEKRLAQLLMEEKYARESWLKGMVEKGEGYSR